MWNYVFYSAALIYCIGGFCFLTLASTEPEPWGLALNLPQDSQEKKLADIESAVSRQ